jgi:hypothetical protein
MKNLEELIKSEEKIKELAALLERLSKVKKHDNKRLKLVKGIIGKLALISNKKLDNIDNLMDKYLMFDLNDLTSALAYLISKWENKEYVVEKACYISTNRFYTTGDEKYIPTFQYDTLLIISKDCLQQGSRYYNYYLDKKLENRDALMLNKSNNARETKENLLAYTGYYDGDNKKLEFKDKSNFSGNGIISVKEEDFNGFKYAYRFVEYLINKRIKFKMTDLTKKDIYKFMGQFLKEKININTMVEESKKTS